jgi:ABC-type lipoprotein export system ATPase subunit
MKWIEVKNVTKSFGLNTVLHEVNLSVDKQEHCVLRGASGSGKSTLFYLLGGLDKPTSGKITINQKDITLLDSVSLAQYRNKDVGFVFQFHFLLPSMTALQNILLPANIGFKVTAEKENEVRMWAKLLKVEHCLAKFPHQLSGGEQQRINIIRAISLRPALLLCDEPTGNLDSKNSEVVIGLLKDLAAETQATLMVVTHDEKVASHFPRKITIEDGRIIG